MKMVMEKKKVMKRRLKGRAFPKRLMAVGISLFLAMPWAALSFAGTEQDGYPQAEIDSDIQDEDGMEASPDAYALISDGDAEEQENADAVLYEAEEGLDDSGNDDEADGRQGGNDESESDFEDEDTEEFGEVEETGDTGRSGDEEVTEGAGEEVEGRGETGAESEDSYFETGSEHEGEEGNFENGNVTEDGIGSEDEGEAGSDGIDFGDEGEAGSEEIGSGDEGEAGSDGIDSGNEVASNADGINFGDEALPDADGVDFENGNVTGDGIDPENENGPEGEYDNEEVGEADNGESVEARDTDLIGEDERPDGAGSGDGPKDAVNAQEMQDAEDAETVQDIQDVQEIRDETSEDGEPKPEDESYEGDGLYEVGEGSNGAESFEDASFEDGISGKELNFEAESSPDTDETEFSGAGDFPDGREDEDAGEETEFENPDAPAESGAGEETDNSVITGESDEYGAADENDGAEGGDSRDEWETGVRDADEGSGADVGSETDQETDGKMDGDSEDNSGQIDEEEKPSDPDASGLGGEEEEAALMETKTVAYAYPSDFNRKMKTLANGKYKYYYSDYDYIIDFRNCGYEDSRITSFEKASLQDWNNWSGTYYDATRDSKDNDRGISDYPIYVWMDGETIKWYSPADKISFIAETIHYTGGDPDENEYPLFFNCRGLKKVDFEGIDTSNLTGLRSMFYGCSSLESVDLSGFDTRKVTDMNYMFYGCENLKSLDLSMLNTASVKNTQYMFSGCSNLESLNLEGMKTAKVTDMSYMFDGCSNLKSLDVSSFKTSKVTNMESMFHGCSSLRSLDVSGFDTSKVSDMSEMFSGCGSLKSLNVNGFDTSNVINMSKMFYECGSLTSLNLRSFETKNVTSFEDMFSFSSKLKTIYAGDGFVTDSEADSSKDMFLDCEALVGGNGTAYDADYIGSGYARIDAKGTPGYFTKYGVTKVTGVSLSKTTLSLTVGKSVALTATVSPAKATNKGVTWKSGNSSVATVKDGKVTAVAPGTAKITVKTSDGGKTAVCTVTVKAPISKASVSLSKTSYVYNGKEIKPGVTVKYGGEKLQQDTDFTVSYSENVNAGTAKVMITGKKYYAGTKNVTFQIKKAAQDLSITKPAEGAALPVGSSSAIAVSGAEGALSYQSGNTAVMTVTDGGVVTAKKVGTAEIVLTASATDNYKAASITLLLKATPAKTAKLTLKNTSNGVKLNWKKVAGATGYYIYRNGKKLATIKKASTVAYTDKKAKSNGAKYRYQVYAYANTGRGAASAKKTMYYMAAPKISSVKNSASKKIVVQWKKNAKASGYEVKYVLGSSTKTKTISKAATVKATLSGLKKGKTYKVSVRSFKTVGKTKYYSPWSAAKSVKVKK